MLAFTERGEKEYGTTLLNQIQMLELLNPTWYELSSVGKLSYWNHDPSCSSIHILEGRISRKPFFLSLGKR